MKFFWLMIFFIPLAVALYAAGAWLIIIAVGMIHALWLSGMPTMGYHTALALAWIPGFFFGGSAASNSNGRK